MLNELKKLRKKLDEECDVELYSCRSVDEFLSTMLEIDFNKTLSTLDQIFQVMGLESGLTSKLVEEMENMSDTIEQCYEANIVNDMIDRGFLYYNHAFNREGVIIPFKDVLFKDIDEVIGLAEQLKEIKELDERKDK